MNMKRQRGRNHRGPGGGGGPTVSVRPTGGAIPLNRNHVFDSSGPDLRIRGTAQQLFEKYLQLGRDAGSAGDKVMAEAYFQYAEHYYRVLGAMQAAQQQQAPAGGQHYQSRRPPQEPTETGDASAGGMGEQPEEAAREIPIGAPPQE